MSQEISSQLYGNSNTREYQTFWIDAVYINQNDTVERSRQVRRMKSIYERAHHVVAWIGPHAQGSEIVMAKLIEIMQVIRDQVAEGKDEITATQFVSDNLMDVILGKKITDF